MRLLGAILAGGRSSRYGSDKAVALLEGRALIDHVADRLGPQVAALVICGRVHGDLTALADCPAPDLGPLGGLCAALRHAQDHGFDAVVSAGCDLPALPTDLVARLRSGGDRASYVEDCPIVGYWPAALAGQLERFLRPAGSRAVRAWCVLAGARPERFAAPLVNINRPADLDTFLRP